MSRKIKEIKNIVDNNMRRCGSTNISIHLFVTKEEIEELGHWFKITREPFGYTKFERKQKEDRK